MMLKCVSADWDVVTVGDVFDIQQGKSLSPKSRAGISPRSFLRTANVLWGQIDITTLDEMDFSDEEVAKFELRIGDILVCEGGDIGRTAVWKHPIKECCYQNHLHRLKKRFDNVDSDFFSFWMRAGWLLFNVYGGEGNKTTIPNLSKSRLQAFEMPLPVLPEQRSIAAVLSKIQEAITAQQEIIDRTRELKKALMAKLFTKGLRGEKTKETEIGPVPESWKIRKIGDKAKLSSGGTPSRTCKEYWEDGTIPWVKTGEIDYKVIVETEEHITPLGMKNSAAKLFPKGTLLMAMYGQGITRGKVAILGIDATTNQACAAIFPDDDVDTEYLYYYLAFSYDRLRSLSHGAQQKNLSGQIVASFKFAYPMAAPSLQEQKEIASILKQIDVKLELAEGKHRLFEDLFKTMLHELMTGRTRTTGVM